MAAAVYLSVPAKSTIEVDFAKPLQKFITTTFANVAAENYEQSLVEFNKLRSQVINKLADKHESTLDVLNRYYDQLAAIESKLPIAENQIRINFKWYSAFGKDSIFGGKKSLSIASGTYEKVCVLFNIAALQSQLAENQNHDSDDGLKASAKYFQNASGIFSHLKDCVLSHVQQDPTPDLSPDALSALSALMVAQAQDCFFRKARKDRMKDAIIAKVAQQCSDLYSEALTLLQLNSIKDMWPRDWTGFVAGRQAAFHSLAEYHQAQVAGEKKAFGEQIARLQHACELMQAAETRAGNTFKFTDDKDRMNRQLQTVKKDNDFIYHDIVPGVKTLSPIGKAPIAKPLPLTAPLCNNFKDLFDKLVPLAVHQALGVFDSRKAEIINQEVSRLREATTLLNSVLASLNLPAAIEDLSGGGKLPQSVLEKAAKISELGGITAIEKLMQELPESLQRNREILDECFRLLDDEQTSDQQLRTQFKERWTRTASEKLTETLRAEIAKYKGILDTAVQADTVVKTKYGSLRNGIQMLSKSPGDLESSMPSAAQQAQLNNSAAVKQLRDLMKNVDTIKAEREAMEVEIKDTKFDMASKFMNALAADGIVNQESISEQELDTMFGPLRGQVNDSLHRQETLLAEIQRANSEFAQARQSNQSAAERDKVLKDLAEAFDGYMELKNNLEEGNKFYNDLTQLLLRCQGKISDFCFARKTERDELMKDLQRTIANQPTQTPPAAPSYHQPTQQPAEAPKRTAPARPPPPASGSTTAPVAPPRPPPVSQTYAAANTSVAPPAYSAPAASASASSYTQSAPPYPYGQYQPPPPVPMGYNPYAMYGTAGQQPPQQSYPGYPPQAPQQYGGYPGYPTQPQGGYPMPQNPYGGYPQQQNNPYQQPPQWR
ncbi:programmed cell death 6-interacting protein-like isoform X2 [Tubulanus polymorphus]|uniref:programmed cell death 6-interacting protein-like isoform X2 n=1 Tax=Tubulanus polymorphus TaxID=672921 RepID=UPI003DA1CEE2